MSSVNRLSDSRFDSFINDVHKHWDECPSMRHWPFPKLEGPTALLMHKYFTEHKDTYDAAEELFDLEYGYIWHYE